MSVIVWPKVEGNQLPPNLEERLASLLRGRVQRAYFFGSYKTDAFHAASDIDLILVKNTETPFVDRASEFMDLHKLYPRLDILVYTEDELAQQLQERVGFWASVKDSLRELPLN